MIATHTRYLMHDWLFNDQAEEFALSSDESDEWRTGGDLGEVIEEANLSPQWIMQGITRFAVDHEQCMQRLRDGLDAISA